MGTVPKKVKKITVINHINVYRVKKLLNKYFVLQNICLFTQERDHIAVKLVETHLNIKAILQSI